jgi:hypothetical protein
MAMINCEPIGNGLCWSFADGTSIVLGDESTVVVSKTDAERPPHSKVG